jgi:hypothetical protein
VARNTTSSELSCTAVRTHSYTCCWNILAGTNTGAIGATVGTDTSTGGASSTAGGGAATGGTTQTGDTSTTGATGGGWQRRHRHNRLRRWFKDRQQLDGRLGRRIGWRNSVSFQAPTLPVSLVCQRDCFQ